MLSHLETGWSRKGQEPTFLVCLMMVNAYSSTLLQMLSFCILLCPCFLLLYCCYCSAVLLTTTTTTTALWPPWPTPQRPLLCCSKSRVWGQNDLRGQQQQEQKAGSSRPQQPRPYSSLNLLRFSDWAAHKFVLLVVSYFYGCLTRAF